MQEQRFIVVTEKDGEQQRHVVRDHTPQRACKAAEAERFGADAIAVKVTWRVVAKCEKCGTPLFSHEDYTLRRGKVRCWGC